MSFEVACDLFQALKCSDREDVGSMLAGNSRDSHEIRYPLLRFRHWDAVSRGIFLGCIQAGFEICFEDDGSVQASRQMDIERDDGKYGHYQGARTKQSCDDRESMSSCL